MTSEAPRYRAFVSYTRADRTFAERLHRQLESYALPAAVRALHPELRPIRRPLRPVFLDEDELVPGGDLPGRIRDGLESSHYLIVICSPSARQSQWVNREVSEFIALGRRAQILAVVVAGEPYAEKRGFPPALECLPDALLAVESGAEVPTDAAELILGRLAPGTQP